MKLKHYSDLAPQSFTDKPSASALRYAAAAGNIAKITLVIKISPNPNTVRALSQLLSKNSPYRLASVFAKSASKMEMSTAPKANPAAVSAALSSSSSEKI